MSLADDKVRHFVDDQFPVIGTETLIKGSWQYIAVGVATSPGAAVLVLRDPCHSELVCIKDPSAQAHLLPYTNDRRP